ncbi:6645_t:CDS:2 [Funneliformis caledonium]|uniref:6645_t:CDS:1 n=1 Tax=Funneliformis caledonium TaxID=1117310 RepID=A0A9N9FZX1_9GLOM|nr:6645_t:CDS:2 [Funneliformis caledonium]
MNISSPQPLKLPIPRLSTSTHHSISNEMQQTDDITKRIQQPTNKPSNKRGRKPLSSMPTTKKHIQNLINQRAFRQRREYYIRNLETKASEYEELFKGAQEEIESLKEKVALLEKQVAVEEGINCFNHAVATNPDIGYHSTADQQPQSGECFTTFTNNVSPTTSTFSFNDQHGLVTRPSQISCGLPSIDTIDNIIRDPIFCETKEGKICYCEPGEIRTTTAATTKCLSDNKQSTEKRVWIIPTSVSPLYSDFVTTNDYSPDEEDTLSSQWGLSYQDYFSPAVSSAVVSTTANSFTQFNPLNLKWILGNVQTR